MSLWKPHDNSSKYFTFLSEFQDIWDGQVVIEEIVIAVITVVALGGNSLILVAACSQERPLATIHLLLANQCTSNVLSALNNPVIMVTRVSRHWILGDAACKIFSYLQYATYATSVWTMVALAVDRYLSVCGSKASTSRMRPHAWKVMAATWVSGFGWFSPFLAGFRELSLRQDGVTYTWCYLLWPPGIHNLSFVLASGVFLIVLPLSVIVVCYARVLITVHESSKRVNSTRLQMEKRLTMVLIYLVVLFMLMCFPFFAINVAVILTTTMTSTIYVWFQLLPVSNTAMDPLLIIYLIPKYRKTAATLLSPLCRRSCPTCSYQQNQHRQSEMPHANHRDSDIGSTLMMDNSTYDSTNESGSTVIERTMP